MLLLHQPPLLLLLLLLLLPLPLHEPHLRLHPLRLLKRVKRSRGNVCARRSSADRTELNLRRRRGGPKSKLVAVRPDPRVVVHTPMTPKHCCRGMLHPFPRAAATTTSLRKHHAAHWPLDHGRR